MSDLTSFYFRKHTGYRGNQHGVNKNNNNYNIDDVEGADVTARYETDPYHKQQLVEEWLIKSHSAEGPDSYSDYANQKDYQQDKQHKVIKWPSIYTTDNIDNNRTQFETTEFRGQGHSGVQGLNENESFENWKQSVAKKKEVAKQQQAVGNRGFEKAYQRHNNAGFSDEENGLKVDQGQSAREFEKWQDSVKVVKRQQSANGKLTLPKIEFKTIMEPEPQTEDVTALVTESRPRRSRQREEIIDETDQRYQNWLLESNRARNVLPQHVNLVDTEPNTHGEPFPEGNNSFDEALDYSENGPDYADFGSPRHNQYSPVLGLENNSDEQNLIFQQFLRMKQAEEWSKHATIMRLGANYEHKGFKERLAEGTKTRKPRKIRFEGDIEYNDVRSKPPVSKISGIRNLREIEPLQRIEENSGTSSVTRKVSKNSNKFPVVKEDLNDAGFKRPLRKSNRSIDSNSNRSDSTFISDGVFLPIDQLNISSK